MRGGVGLSDLLHTYSADDREILYEIISENIELTKASQMPLL
jgi:hypothetical protein